MTSLLCRICWNTEGWRRPTGEARHLETNSYVAVNGFGHEEWLFNQEWPLDGYCYGFIQALNSSRKKYSGQTVSLELYTRSPAGHWCTVATMQDVQVLTDSQTEAAFGKMRQLGWLDSKAEDLARLGIRGDILATAKPHELINLRYHPDSANLLDPPGHIRDQETFDLRYRRYRAFNLLDPNLTAIGGPVRRGRRAATRLKSDEARLRRGTLPGSQDPKHDRLQNAVHAFLKTNCSKVEYEADYIDLRAEVGGVQCLFEVKAASTAKRCIREALGQLLEYAHYPDRECQHTLVVVGDAPFDNSDRAYVALLRKRYGVHLQYVRWDWSNNCLVGLLTDGSARA
jgi:hypothetical protein